jgi:adenosylcobinamide kinase/adenosylcobinamide-phosphate guanylyltransferase
MGGALMLARCELIVGGQRSGKSARAEALAEAWLAGDARRHALLIATALVLDDDMAQRVRRHQSDRAARLPALRVVEEPLHIAQAIDSLGDSRTLVVVDCLTLWLSAWMVPAIHGSAQAANALSVRPFPAAAAAALLDAIPRAPGPLVFVSNEIGLGVIPADAMSRCFVDALGRLNQRVAAACSRVTLMVAGVPVPVKDQP